jgi:hypothetical protein
LICSVSFLSSCGDDRLDRLDDVAADQLGLRQRLLGERAHRRSTASLASSVFGLNSFFSSESKS